jgi:acyl-CoA thioester hydrolase
MAKMSHVLFIFSEKEKLTATRTANGEPSPAQAAIRYNNGMPDYNFSITVEARYGDLDPQWHVNNVRYLSYLEQGRLAYLVYLGLWDGLDFNQLGLIVADIHIAYLAPMMFMEKARLDVRIGKIGNKSLTFEYQLVSLSQSEPEKVLARAEAVLVAFDYPTQRTKPVPSDWRAKISTFEGKDFLLKGDA